MKHQIVHVLASIFFAIASISVFAQASVTTDQSDYPPGSTVVIAGSGFQPGETVQLQVINLSNSNDDGVEHEPWTVVADENGNFTTSWYVTPDESNTSLQLTARGLSSDLVAETDFTDANYNVSSISIGNQTGTLIYGTAGSATYTITNFFSGNGQSVNRVTNLVAAGLPTGATASFALVPTTGPGSGGASGVAGAFTNKLSITTLSTTPAGSFTITVVGNDDKGGHATNTATFTVDKTALSITADNDVKIYGQTKTYGTGQTTFSSSGLKNSETIGSVTITASGGTNSNSALGVYTLTPSAATGGTFNANNYTITYNTGTLTVIPGPASTLTVSGYPNPRMAGDPGTVTVTAKDQFGNTATNYIGTVHLTSSDAQASLAANHTFTAGDAGVFQFTGNIFGTTGIQSLTATDIHSNTVTGTQSGIVIVGGMINKLVFSTQPAGAVYKTAFATQPVVQTVDAFGNPSTNGLPASLTLSLALTTGTGPLAGTTSIDIGTAHSAGVATFSGLQINKAENGDILTASAPGYTSTNSSAFNISPATLTVSATGVNKIYDGTTNAAVTLSDNKFSGDIVTDNYLSASFADKNVGNGKTVSVGGISIGGASAANYTLSSTTASTTANISAAALTVTANDTNRVYGAANPVFTASYSGFAGGDNSGVLNGAADLTCAANATSSVGGSPYVIVATNGTLSAANYTFEFVSGQLTITQASTTNAVSVSANPSPTGSNVTLTATISAVASGSGTATGTIQFLVDGSPIGSPATLSSGVGNLTTASLAHGNHTISAQYTGDGNFFGSTNNPGLNLLIDKAPTAGTFTLTTTENVSANFAAAKLAGAAKDADHDALSFTSVNSTSAQDGTVSLAGGVITYLPPTNYAGADSFNYTIADSFGLTASGTVTVTVNATTSGQTLNLASLSFQPGGAARLQFAGIPHRAYLIQATTNMASPVWTTIATNTAASNGLFIFIDNDAPNYPTRYYRTATP